MWEMNTNTHQLMYNCDFFRTFACFYIQKNE